MKHKNETIRNLLGCGVVSIRKLGDYDISNKGKKEQCQVIKQRRDVYVYMVYKKKTRNIATQKILKRGRGDS